MCIRDRVTVKKPAKATVAAKNDSVKVTIKKVAGAAGYEVQYSTSKKFTKKTTKSKTTKKTSYTCLLYTSRCV